MMKKLISKLSAIATTSAALSLTISVNAPQANAGLRTYALSWDGSNGYSATGLFSFDDSLLGNIISKNDLDSLSISFFDPTGSQLESFEFPFPASEAELNFNFNSATGKVIQSGAYDNPTEGLDLRINYYAGETGLDFYTANGENFPFFPPLPLGTLVLDNNVQAKACYPSQLAPVGCARLSTGGTLTVTATATAVPEPASVVSWLALGAIGADSTLKKKLGSVQVAKSRSVVR
ncbi:MAG TPA: hypothetical protein V6D15_24720 [Oculatellaceae cyanobacterium]|jgi:hypothetical protein